MDTNMEDKMYHQIEKSLSDSINENLFLNGNSPALQADKLPAVRSSREMQPAEISRGSNNMQPAQISRAANNISPVYRQEADYIDQQPILSRAEYIRQAREACLRQLSNQSIQIMDACNPESIEQQPDVINKKKVRAMQLFKDSDRGFGLLRDGEQEEELNSPQEIASFRSLIIRMVCAIVLFLAVFLIDKFNFSVGGFSKSVIREYVTGKDVFEKLEQLVVAWFK